MRLLEAHIEVADVGKSVDLYKKLLDYNKIDSWDDGNATAFVLDGGEAFGIWAKGKRGIHGGQGGSHVHFAFQIFPDAYDTYVKRVQDAGLEPLHHVWPDGQRSVYFFDYDGHQGEFMTVDWLGRKS